MLKYDEIGINLLYLTFIKKGIYTMKTDYFLSAASFLLVMAFTSPVSAQGPYFDIGIGVGSGTTQINGVDFAKFVKGLGGNIDEMAVDFGFKIGYGPIAHKPIYVIGEFDGMGHRIEGNSKYVQFNSYLFGPGVIFYPISLLQLGASLGYSWAKLVQENELVDESDGGGFAWNISAAVDLGGGNHGCLIGLKYFSASNDLKLSKVDMESSMIGLFVKYTYRKKEILLSE